MQNITRLFAKYGSHITFILLQTICFYIIVQYNHNQQSIFLNSSNLYVGKVTQKLGNWNSYLKLDEVNDSLSTHNADLLELYINRSETDPEFKDTSLLQYKLIPTKIINNTYDLRNNHITLNKGADQNIKNDMGVISQHGLVGIIRNTSTHFSHVVSLLHTQTRISATVKPYAYPGTLKWNGTDPKQMSLESIPKHVNIAVGDTIVTSGYSTIFPKGIIIGTIKSFDIDRGSSNYNIDVTLANDIPNEQVVYVVNNRYGKEQLELEQEIDE